MVIPFPEILFSPGRTLEETKDSLSGSAAVLIELSAWLSLLTGLLLFFDRQVTFGQFVLLYAFCALSLAAVKLLKSLLIHFFAEALGGKGRITRFLTLLGYADLPLHFFLPLGLLLGGRSALLLIAVLFGLAAWSGGLATAALKAHYGLTWPKSLVAAFAPSLLIVLPALAVAAALAGFFAGMSVLLARILKHL